jgi:SAM-dependent methyltransferase
MQVAYPGVPTDFYTPYPLRRRNDASDADYYRVPRLVAHLDATAIAQVTALHGRLLVPGTRVLDLMSSWASHLPPALHSCTVTGLGMNEQELQANDRLAKWLVHDLNLKPSLPFDHGQFEAVVCTASIEYLTRPREVMTEISRVLKPGGVFVTTFSDRWFPGKEIEAWSDLHRFERLGYVLDCTPTPVYSATCTPKRFAAGRVRWTIRTSARRSHRIRSTPFGAARGADARRAA